MYLKSLNAAINNQGRCIAIHLFSKLLLVIINCKILFSDDDTGTGKELPGTSWRWTLAQVKIVGELAKLNKQLADMLSLKKSHLSLVTNKYVKQWKEKSTTWKRISRGKFVTWSLILNFYLYTTFVFIW